MDDSNASPMSLSARFISLIAAAYDAGMTPDQVSTTIAAVQRLVDQLGPSSQQKSTSQPGAAPRK